MDGLCKSDWYRKIDKFSTNLSDFSDEQLENVLDQVIAASSMEMWHGGGKKNESASGLFYVLSGHLLHQYQSPMDRAGWTRHDPARRWCR